MTEARLQDLVHSLGMSADAVARTLSLRRVRGVRSSGSTCPIAVFLSRETSETIIVGLYDICVHHSAVTVRTPHAVRTFIERFDAGKYPYLVRR